MEADKRVELERLMAALAADRCDEEALNALFQVFFDDLEKVVGFEARRRRPHVGADEVAGLVWDACEEIAAVACTWRPDGGALPWVWARRRIDAAVAREYPVGHEALDPDSLEEADEALWRDCLDDPEPGVVLAEAVRRHPANRSLQLVAEVLRALPPADAELLLRYDEQKQAGDPSPAHTLGPQYGLNPPAVRQRTSRARRRLREVVASDARYADLAGLPLLTGAA